MPALNYNSSAELFPSRRFAKSQTTQYRRFGNAAEAIRYAIEDMPAKWLVGSYLEIDEKRFEGEAIRGLYESEDFPLARATEAA